MSAALQEFTDRRLKDILADGGYKPEAQRTALTKYISTAQKVGLDDAEAAVKNAEIKLGVTPAADAVEPVTSPVETVKADDGNVRSTGLSKATATFKDLAEPLIQRGIPVIPLLPRAKKAFSNEWPTLATTDLAQVLRWDAEYPAANIGCVGLAKTDGICFFEIDDPALFHRIEQETGQKFPTTFRVRSSPGKGHIYFRHTAATIELANKKAYYSLKNSDGSEACSVRLNHAYVVGPGSIHPDTHKPYEIISLAAVADFPEWLVEWIKKNLANDENKLQVTASTDGPRVLRGSHDNELFRIACKLRGDGLEYEEILGVLVRNVEERFDNVGSDWMDMCEKKAKSACRYPAGTSSQIILTSGGRTLEEIAQQAQNGTTQATSAARKLVLTRADRITPKQVHWFWENRIFANKPNVLFGEPGLGKGFIGTDFIARMTTQTDFFDGPNDNPACDAVICCAEDSPEETILPRLIVAGADRTRVHFLSIQEGAESVEEGLMHLDTDLPALAQMVELNPQIRIILIDPLATYMGELDPNKDKQVRPVYTKLAQFAEKRNVCFILVAHPNKQEQSSAINRLSGAKALNSVFRNTWLVEKDPEDSKRRLMLSVKGNLAGEDAKKGLKFEIENIADTGIMAEGEPIKNIGRLVWLDATNKTADEALQDAASGGRKYAQKKGEKIIEDFLIAFLADGEAHLGKEFFEQAEKAGIETNDWSMRRLKAKHVSQRKLYGEWWWANNIQALDDKQTDIEQHNTINIQPKTDADTHAWLVELLHDGALPVSTIRAASNGYGYNWESIRAHRHRWGIESVEINGEPYWQDSLAGMIA